MILDKKTIKRIQRRNRKTEFELYKSCFQYWMSVAMPYLRNESESASCINDSFIKMCNNIGNYSTEYSFITWSRTILVRTILDELRKNKTYKEKIKISDEIELYETAHETKSEENEEELTGKVLQAIEVLPEATKKVVKLYLLEGYTHQEVSEILNISSETSKWHVKTGKQKLRDLLSH